MGRASCGLSKFIPGNAIYGNINDENIITGYFLKTCLVDL